MAKTYFYPAYLNDFKCIGSACEDSCCVGWNIPIDKKTYLKYKRIKDAAFAATLPARVKRVRGAAASDAVYAQFVMGEHKNCPYLDENSLCEIQLTYGESYLCVTCSTYPRTCMVLIPGQYEVSLSMSCPEAVRKALFNPEPMIFIQTEEAALPPHLAGFARLASGQQAKLNLKSAEVLWEMRDICIDIMQWRLYSIPERILIIGMLLARLDVPMQEKQASSTLEIITEYRDLLQRGAFAGAFASFPHNDAMREQMEYQLFQLSFRQGGAGFEDFRRAVILQLGLLTGEEKKTITLDTLIASAYSIVKQREDTVFKPFLQENSHLFENYFVNYMFQQGFPFNFDGVGLAQHVILLAEQYALLRTFLCVSAEGNGITDAVFVRAVAPLSRLNQHNPTATKSIVQNYAENGIDDLAHVSFLLR